MAKKGEGVMSAGNFSNFRVVDLTFPLDEFLQKEVVEWVPGITYTPTATIEGLGRSVHRVVMATHCGTHMDPPAHFIKGGTTIDQVPFSSMIGEAILLDLGGKAAGEHITGNDLERVGSDVKKGDIVILRTGWDRMWGSRDFFWKAPYLSSDAAEWLVKRKIATLGFDLPCPDNMNIIKPNTLPPIHMALLSKDINIIEMLANLGAIDQRRFMFIALPLKFKGMDGSPIRAVALLP